MTGELRPAIVTGPDDADASVILLHGLGADGHDLEPLISELSPAGASVRFILPHAPYRAVTVNSGYEMRAWYDIRSADLDTAPDEEGIRTSGQQLRDWIEAERQQGVAPERIVVAGFSQGGAIALHTGLRYPLPLAGIMALSTYLPLPESLAGEIRPHAGQVPIFMAHGRADPIVPLNAAVRSRRRLRELGCEVQWEEYPIAHTISAEEVRDARHWLMQVLVRSER